MRSLLAVGALALCAQTVFTGTALAQPKSAMQPKVKTLEPAEGVPGTNVLVVGNNFTDKMSDIEVTANGTKCLILETDLEKFRFLIPANPAPAPGPLKIEIKIAGNGACTTTFKIVDQKNAAAEKERREKERQKYEGAAVYEDPYKKSEALLSIKKFEITAGSNPTAVVEGDTTLPAGMFVTVSFGIMGAQAEQQIATHKIIIRGNTWKTTFGAPPSENWAGKTLLAGKYYAHLQFEMTKQSGIDLKKAGWPDKLSKEERELRELIYKKEIRDVGTPEEMKKQEEDLKGHYVELCRATTDCLELLERAYAAAGKSYFKKPSGGGIEEGEWEAWVKDRKIGQTEEDMKKIKADNRFVKGAYFNAEPWQKWVEDEYFKKAGDAYKKHEDIKKKYITVRDQRVESEGDYLLSVIVKLAQTYSGEIYGRNKLEVPQSLRAPKEFAAGLESVAVSRGHFEGHRKLLLERLGLASFEPGKKEDKK